MLSIDIGDTFGITRPFMTPPRHRLDLAHGEPVKASDRQDETTHPVSLLTSPEMPRDVESMKVDITYIHIDVCVCSFLYIYI